MTWVLVTGATAKGTKDPDFRARFKAEVRNRDTWMIPSQNGEAVGRVVVLKQVQYSGP